jgi:hypothetical protein
MHRGDPPDDHQKFQEMAALAQGRELTDREELELARHLQQCDLCRGVYDEFSVISTEGMTFLAVAGGHVSECESWDRRTTRNRLASQIRKTEPSGPVHISSRSAPIQPLPVWKARGVKAALALAACFLLAVAIGAYHLGSRAHRAQQLSAVPAQANVPHHPQQMTVPIQDPASEKKSSDDLIASQATRIAQLQKQITGNQKDLASLHVALKAAEDRSAQLSAVNTNEQSQLRHVSEERDTLAAQVREAEKAYQLLQAEFTTLRAEHDRAVLRTASLESKVEELSSSASDQERKLKDDEQYLSSDRDIRELMGARKLYIADVFDVDSGSRTRKAFGRVFYTQNKSLIFYAFDLDRQPGVKNASAFQVWGQRDAESGPKSHPMNLGILYMDSESNRRWVLRWDDPKQLAEIDAVFVTVEPHGGSQKPTGKPFLYALLRKEANHP